MSMVVAYAKLMEPVANNTPTAPLTIHAFNMGHLSSISVIGVLK